MPVRRKVILPAAVSLLILLTSAINTRPAAAQGQLQDRPHLPDEQTYATEHFVIHYTYTGDAGIKAIDEDASGLPDYIEEVATALEHSWQVEIVQFGWAPPPPDRGEGGDERVDLYLEQLMPDGLAGYAESAGGYVGDNPLTPELERRAAYSYFSIDNDFEEVAGEGGNPDADLYLMRATVAHEFNHVIQGGYDDFDPQYWLYEATATWMEEEVYDEVNDGVNYLPDLFNAPDVCRVSDVGWYASWLFLRLMSEKYGHDVVRAIWENSRQLDGFDAIDAALEPYGSSLEAESQDFALANLLRDYDEGQEFPLVALEGQIGEGSLTPDQGVQSLGADYIRLTARQVVDISLTASGGPLTAFVVGITGSDAQVYEIPGAPLTIDLSPYSDAFVVVHNDHRVGLEVNCEYESYTITVTASGGAPATQPETWSALNFTPPETEVGSSGLPIAGSSSYHPPYAEQGEASESPEELVTPFEAIIPTAVPGGYFFDYAYIMTAEDFGGDEPYYVPGGGDAANYDYLTEDDFWLGVVESASPYTALNEWLDDVGYEPAGDIRTVDNVEVLVEDLSEDEDIWFSATLILNGLFIVVDGDHNEEDVISMVESLIAAAQSPTPGAVQLPPVDNEPAQDSSPLPSTGGFFTTLSGIALLVFGGATCVVALVLVIISAIQFRRERR